MAVPPNGPDKDPEDADNEKIEPEITGDLEETEDVIEGEIVDDDTPHPDRRVQYAGRFRGPLPPPAVLQQYDGVIKGLAQDIVAQWKGETDHRHTTIDGLRKTDNEAMRAFYKAELLGQLIAGILFLGVLVLAFYAISEHEPVVGVAALLTAGASGVWAMRRRSNGSPGPPTDLGDSDKLEKP
jgi:uncharacterized membrane protein